MTGEDKAQQRYWEDRERIEKANFSSQAVATRVMKHGARRVRRGSTNEFILTHTQMVNLLKATMAGD